MLVKAKVKENISMRIFIKNIGNTDIYKYVCSCGVESAYRPTMSITKSFAISHAEMVHSIDICERIVYWIDETEMLYANQS